MFTAIVNFLAWAVLIFMGLQVVYTCWVKDWPWLVFACLGIIAMVIHLNDGNSLLKTAVMFAGIAVVRYRGRTKAQEVA